MMDWLQFSRQLRRDGSYRTPADLSFGVADHLLGRFDWWYHAILSHKVITCGRLARNGMLTDALWAEKCLQAMQCVERCGGQVDIVIEPGVAEAVPCVYAANHMSVLETVILPAILLAFAHPAVVVKESLLRYPALHHILKATGVISVSRSDPRQDLQTVMKEGLHALKNGTPVLIFPQATRNPVFDVSLFNSLASKLARKAGVPLVPIALKTDFCGIGPVVKEFGKIHRSRTVHFHLGTPLSTDGNARAVHEESLRFLAETLRGWGTQVVNDSALRMISKS